MAGPYCGVIEGFYGKSWSWAERADYMQFMARHNYRFYIYAPKSDRYLRDDWSLPWPDEQWLSLLQLRQHCRHASIAFGIGLSPYAIFQRWGQDKAESLRDKIRYLNQLQPDIFWLLFDDMRGDVPGLAALQAEITGLVAEETVAESVLMCPSYYSFDPVLEQLFGDMPEGYWSDLGNRLDDRIGILWTGDRVCSSSYSRQSLDAIADKFKRRPLIWDNYAVNDGRLASQ